MRTTEGLYECHVTMEFPPAGELWHVYNDVAQILGWYTSWIDGDPVLGERRHFYFTTLAGSEDAARARIEELVGELPRRPLRRKIEHVVVDVR